MNKKIQNLKEAEYYANFNLVGEYIMAAKKKRPDSKAVLDMQAAWQEVAFFVHNLLQEQKFYNQSLAEYKNSEHKAKVKLFETKQKLKDTAEKLEILMPPDS